MNQRLYFYHREQLALEIEGANSLTMLRGADQPLAERRSDNLGAETRLLMTDVQKSLLQMYIGETQKVYAYTAYGHDPRLQSAATRLGFNGEHREQLIGAYMLGQGYRAYSPILRRFHTPDDLSPFAEGGNNAYTYCLGDPVNFSDPTGHLSVAELLAVKLKPVGQATVAKSVPLRRPSGPVPSAPSKKQVAPKPDYSNWNPQPDLSDDTLILRSYDPARPKKAPGASILHQRSGLSLFAERRRYYQVDINAVTSADNLQRNLSQFYLASHYMVNKKIKLSPGIRQIRLNALEKLAAEFDRARKSFAQLSGDINA
ncbi:TPA: RHS repeat-associated core domain-containing protein [Pseudomonas putida]|nr:RHS repeat-associated core domain-containing protein [Pseudomonas putida]